MDVLVEINGQVRQVSYSRYLALVRGGEWEKANVCKKGGLIVRFPV